jgi:hypothetical protein
VFLGVSITPQRLTCETSGGWVAKIRGTNEQYVYARTFLDRSHAAPYGWPLPGLACTSAGRSARTASSRAPSRSRARSAARFGW